MDARFNDMVRQARNIWFKGIKKEIQGGRKRMRCDENDEEQEVTHAPTMDWDVGDEMNNIRNCVV